MKKRSLAISAAALLALPAFCRATISVPIEQIEAEQSITGNGPDYTYEEYAPVEFGGSPTVAGGSSFSGITFHAVDTANDTNTFDPTFHAQRVGMNAYQNGTVCSPYVTDVYSAGAVDFLLNTVNQYAATGGDIYETGVNPLPGHFATGVKVVNNSWDGSWEAIFNNSNASVLDVPTLRRYDFMVNRDDVLSVAGVIGYGSTTPLLWSSYNTLAVTGTQGFNPQGSTIKLHADLYTNSGDEASFATGEVSGYGAALYGNAETAGQTDAQHGYVMRSLLLAGTDKTIYTNPGGGTAGGMDPGYGAGEPNYDTSLSILQAGEKSLLTVGSGSSVTGTPAAVQKGWAWGNVSAGTQSVVLIDSPNALTGITASLNWNVTSQTSGGTINTTNAAVIFPNLSLQIVPVTYSGGKYVLGASESSPLFESDVSHDNTQYISTTLGLPAGNYALLISGDPSLLATVGLSYSLSGSFASRWNSSSGGSWGSAGLWRNGIPNGNAAQANFLAAPGITSPATITVDGDRTVGQITFNNSNGYTIAQGTVPSGESGWININDSGDSSGTANPLVSVLAGSQTISSPLNLSNGVTTNISSGSALTLSGAITGSGGITKTGPGTVTLSSADSAGSATINAGTLTLSPAGSLTTGPITVNASGTLNFAASTSSGILTRNLAGALNISGGTVTVSRATASANRQLIVPTGGLGVSGSSNAWTGKLDLANNDLDIPNGNLATITNQLKEGYNLAAGGYWNAAGGIVSSAAATDTTHLTTLGAILNTNGSNPLYTTFDGTSVAPTDVLVKYTYYGDANLDGTVNGIDYTRVDNGMLNHLTGWFNGDFNYDGVINGSDYTLIDNAFNAQGAQLSSELATTTAEIAGASAVPEPATAGLLLCASLPVLGRRRHRTKTVRLLQQP